MFIIIRKIKMGHPNTGLCSMKITAFRKAARRIDAPKYLRWYKKYIHRKNRRKAKTNPEAIDKKLDAWEID